MPLTGIVHVRQRQIALADWSDHFTVLPGPCMGGNEGICVAALDI